MQRFWRMLLLDVTVYNTRYPERLRAFPWGVERDAKEQIHTIIDEQNQNPSFGGYVLVPFTFIFTIITVFRHRFVGTLYNWTSSNETGRSCQRKLCRINCKDHTSWKSVEFESPLNWFNCFGPAKRDDKSSSTVGLTEQTILVGWLSIFMEQ